MTRVFVDTNVILDLLLDRHPFYYDAALIASLAEKGEIEVVISALSIANAHYVIRNKENDQVAKAKLIGFKLIVNEVVDLTNTHLDKSLISKMKDFEDALQIHAAIQANCQVIITRNEKDFLGNGLAIISPSQFLRGR